MPIYDKPVRGIMPEMIAALAPRPESIFSKEAAIEWFGEHYPKIKEPTVAAHLIRFSTNASGRLHHNIQPDEDLLFQIDTNHFRRFDPELDPAPIHSQSDLRKPQRIESQTLLTDKGPVPENDLVQESELEFEAEEESGEELQLPISQREVLTRAADPEICSLHDKVKRGRLILQPEFQREFVWDRKKASRLVESVLLRVPLPIIYLSEEPDGREYVIDGQQRLTSLFSFIDGKFPNGEPFKLTGLTAFKELNKKGFAELDQESQDRVEHYCLRTVTLLRQSDPDLKFEIFERLNTGSEPLNDMELRNCVYRGPYNALLKELAAESEFQDLLKTTRPDKRMRDVELVLRFASFYHSTYLQYTAPMKRFYNHDMEKYRNISPADADQLRSAFKNALVLARSLLGTEHAFKRYYPGAPQNPNGRWEVKKFNASLYDVLMGVLCDKDRNQVMAALDCLREGWIDLLSNNTRFNEAITLGTSNEEMVRVRFDLARQWIEGTLREFRRQPRCFTRDLKKQMFEANSTCAICGQAISEIDDAAVDHIEQYWRGGQTIPENARLTHRYCNMARSKKD
jgi:hypothetical protein